MSTFDFFYKELSPATAASCDALRSLVITKGGSLPTAPTSRFFQTLIGGLAGLELDRVVDALRVLDSQNFDADTLGTNTTFPVYAGPAPQVIRALNNLQARASALA
jgi:hypothetical protein